jgi:hypothetical protein
MRYMAYTYLLTDEYPPFEFDDRSYPVRPILPAPATLNRVSVFFRFVLVIPAGVLQVIITYGLLIPMLFVAWLIMVFSGRMPRALYGAYSSMVRYTSRVLAYLLLLTPEYPWGMFGDRAGSTPDAPPIGAPGFSPPYAPPVPSTQPPPPTASPSAETVESGPSSETPGGEAAPAAPTDAPAWPPPPPPNWTAPVPSAAPAWPSEPPPPPPPPPPPGANGERSKLVLSRGSRRWLVFATVWGSILLVGYLSIFVVVGVNSANNTVTQYNTVVNDYNDSKAAINVAIAQVDSCTTVSCLRASHLAAATALDKFNSDLTAMNLPSNAQGPAQVVESDLTQLASVFTDLANSASPQAYRATLQKSNLQTLLTSLTNDTNTLLDALRSNLL